jgi:phenylalanyl-tRNA synthetase beta chain
MKLSYNWLKTYIDLEMTPAQLCELLTGIGLEVGSLEQIEIVRGGLEGLVVGKVILCEPHPDSDHLSKTRVSIGGDDLLPIICGAPNVAAGQKVVVATAGATLYQGNTAFTIKKAKIRGEISEGMICSELEMGLGSDGSGIMVLPDDAPLGAKAKDYFNLETDWVIEIDITPNRIDCASHLGVARDVAASLRQSTPVRYRKPSVENFSIDNQDLTIPVEVILPEACPRYSGVSITGVEVKESPRWLQNRLKSIGLTPINNIVDITNFVLFETGQPLHAFDAGEIDGGRVIVRTSPAGTKFVTLDGTERKLDGTDLIICNEKEGMCIGGVFGGIKSGVKLSTKNIFLESACFDPVFIRRTSRRHGLYTDASFRFERGTDINGTLYAMKRAALLIKEIAGGKISSEIQDFYPHPVEGYPVEVSWNNIRRLIGKNLGEDTIREILSSLEITITNETPHGLNVLVPAYRIDVRRECDVIEEILRIYGYNNVEIPTHFQASLNFAENPDPNQVKNLIAEQLVSQGFHEIWSNSLTKASYYDGLSQFPPEKTVKIYNPLSSDLNGMRQTLLYGGLECISHNINHKNSDLKLFEFGNCYFYRGTHYKDDPVVNYYEEEHLALFLTGNREVPNWTTSEAPSTLHLLRGHVDNMLKRLGFQPEQLVIQESENELFSSGIGISLGKNLLVELGFVNAAWLKKADLGVPVFYADFDWNRILLEHKKNTTRFTEVPRYPEVRRDLALVLDKRIKFSELQGIALKTERHLLKNVDLFDVFEGKGIPEGKKSYAVSFILRDDTKTMTDKIIEKTMEKLLAAFEKELGAKLR